MAKTALKNRGSVGPNAISRTTASEASRRASQWMPPSIISCTRREIQQSLRQEMKEMTLKESEAFLVAAINDLNEQREFEEQPERRSLIGSRLHVVGREVSRVRDELSIERAKAANNEYAVQVAKQNRLLHGIADTLHDMRTMLLMIVPEDKKAIVDDFLGGKPD